VRVFGDGEQALGGRAQNVPVPRRHGQAPFAVERERRSTLKHHENLLFQLNERKAMFLALSSTYFHLFALYQQIGVWNKVFVSFFQ